MLHAIRTKYEHTIYAGYLGYITQAVVNNFAPLLFITFAKDYGLSLEKITLITTINFLVQLLVDLISAKVMDKLGYRLGAVGAHIFAAAGLVGMAVFPSLFADPYIGLLLAVVLYAVGGGTIEVLISPIIEACPTKKKEAAMSLLHSFYCWGHVFMVLVSTAFFAVFGIENWRVLACIWALIPLFNTFYFGLVPLYPIVEEHEKLSLGGLFGKKVFWLLMLIMVCAGASEQAMSQWASAFAESGLKVSKTVGDLAGPCAFAVLMGTSRALYAKYSEKMPLQRFMQLSALLCIGCYIVAAFCNSPLAALAGDVGCSSGPTVVGFIANAFSGSLKTGLAAAMIFPVVILAGISLLKGKTKA